MSKFSARKTPYENAPKGWRYFGDVNVEYGGYFWKDDAKDWNDYGFATVVRVDPCSDAGAQDNAWWVEELTVIKPANDAELASVLSVCGYEMRDGRIVNDHAGETVAEGENAIRACVIECCISYGKYDRDNTLTVQIGKSADSGDERDETPDVILRSNASLERFVIARLKGV